MSKERLLQIVNRLELSPKDKNDLVKEINTNTEKIEKLLENVPEDLDTLKEIINTPADFLNNNHELGGMVNMPFGYGSIHPNTYTYDGSIGDFDIGLLENWYLNKIVIGIHNSNTVVYNIDDITGIDNAKPINGPVNIYVDEDKHLHLISSYKYGSFTFTFSSFSSYKRLPLSFTTPYIVGNDTQEHLDELYRRLDAGESFVSDVYINTNRRYSIYGLGLFTHTHSNYWSVNVIINNGGINNLIVYNIGGSSGQPLRSLITLNKVDESLIIEHSNLVPTPDWNAVEDEPGYIASKFFGVPKERIYLEWSNNTAEINNLGQGITHLVYPTILNNDIFYNIVELKNEDKIVKIDAANNSSAQGQVNITYNDEKYIFNLMGNSRVLDYPWFVIRALKNPVTIPELFIPDTIARTADYELPHITFYEGTNNAVNLDTIRNLSIGSSYVCDVYTGNKTNSALKISNGLYTNGTIIGFRGTELVQYDVNFETGAVTQKLSIDPELIGSEVKLDVCTAGSTEAARNLELLNKAYFALGDHFTVNIDAGIGVAKFIPEAGGEGHITTAEGVNVHYTIGADGSVVKTMEIDIVALYNKVEAITVTVDK